MVGTGSSLKYMNAFIHFVLNIHCTRCRLRFYPTMLLKFVWRINLRLIVGSTPNFIIVFLSLFYAFISTLDNHYTIPTLRSKQKKHRFVPSCNFWRTNKERGKFDFFFLSYYHRLSAKLIFMDVNIEWYNSAGSSEKKIHVFHVMWSMIYEGYVFLMFVLPNPEAYKMSKFYIEDCTKNCNL